LLVLGLELGALCLLGRCSITWNISPALFSFSYFHRASCFCPGPLLDCVCPTYASHVATTTSIPSYPALSLKWGLPNILPMLASSHGPPDIHLPSSWGYRYEPPCPVPILIFYKKNPICPETNKKWSYCSPYVG
jgi:hypothetical protein